MISNCALRVDEETLKQKQQELLNNGFETPQQYNERLKQEEKQRQQLEKEAQDKQSELDEIKALRLKSNLALISGIDLFSQVDTVSGIDGTADDLAEWDKIKTEFTE